METALDLEEGVRRTVRAYLTEKEAQKQRKKKVD